jgi:poly(3-hydroxybutyrate) depolymerase
MYTKWLPTLGVGLSIGIMGCGDSTPGTSSSGGAGGSASGGSSTGGSASGGSSTGGSAAGGTASGGTASGGTASGGTASGGQASGGAATGGSAGGGNSSTGGSGGTGGGSGGSSGGPSAARPSKGCSVSDGAGKLTAGGSSVSNGLPTSTKLSINSDGSNREYIIDIPADYDPTHPYRLIFSWHQAYGSANGNAIGQYPANNGPNFDAENYAYFGLHREATAANEPAIFVAPQGIGNFPWDYDRDVVLFDDLLALIGDNLCVDENRVFTTGFSFGAMMSHALSLGRASKLRGAVTMAPANYNFTQPTNEPASIAYLGITGMSDGTCPWVNDDGAKRGGKYCVLTHAEDNGCTIPGNIQTAMVGSKEYLCQDFEGCEAGYPVKVCTFDGAHTPSSVSDGMSGGDDGLEAFVPPLAWEFITQF